MTVRAKFWVTSVTPADEDGAATVELTAVHSGSEENKEYWKLTPSGHVKLQTINPAAAAPFTPGREFYIDFIPADE